MNSSSYAQRARSHNIPVASEVTRTFLESLVMQRRPSRILEVWSAVGSSSCRFAKVVSWRWGQVISYEISYPSYHRARRRRTQQQCRNLQLYHVDVLNTEVQLTWNKPFDFVFIDGMKSQYADYIHAIRPFCSSGATIVLDDVRSYENKMDALWIYLKEQNIAYEIIDLPDGDGILLFTV
jgi:predicted O-methyltransferase YrrM